MRRILALLLACVMLLTGCGQGVASVETTSQPPKEQVQASVEPETTEKSSDPEATTAPATEQPEEATPEITDSLPTEEAIPSFSGLDDPALLQYVEDTVYAGLVEEFQSEDYIIENVNAVYISKEYLEEMAYNSQANIWFGYTLEEIEAQFEDQRFVFTLGNDGSTVVTAFEDYDDTYERVVKNVAIGSGVILVCVVVSVATAGAATPAVSMVFAASAKTATTFALSSGVFSGVSSGVVEGLRTGDMDAALKAAALSGSEGFKWGAITGAAIGGISELSAIRNTARAVDGATEYARDTVEIADDLPQWRQAELRALNQTGGYEQLTYIDGQLVDFGTPGGTRPDVVVDMVDHIEAVEVKYYNLDSAASRSTLYKELLREVSARVENLPRGSTQKIVLDVTGRSVSAATVESVKTTIWSVLENVYPNIPIEVVGLL